MSNEHEYNRLLEQASQLPYPNAMALAQVQLLVLIRIAAALERFVELADREMGSEQ